MPSFAACQAGVILISACWFDVSEFPTFVANQRVRDIFPDLIDVVKFQSGRTDRSIEGEYQSGSVLCLLVYDFGEAFHFHHPKTLKPLKDLLLGELDQVKV